MAEKKITARVLNERCQELNSTTFKGLPWGLKVTENQQDRSQYDLIQISRKEAGLVKVLVTGATRELHKAIEAINTLVTIERERNKQG